jgi:hypothetical protein
MKKQKGKVWRFFFHYYKQKDMWSVHFRGACAVVDNITCLVPCEGHKQSHQPRRIMRGYAGEVRFKTIHGTKSAIIL